MSAITTRSVEITVEGSQPINVDVEVPSEQTLTLRNKVSKYLKAAYGIWKQLPVEDTGLVATPEVLEQVIHAATAFHTNKSGTVNLVWLKKDEPREALQHVAAAYWKGTAGPAAHTEQQELQNIREISQPIMDHIRATNDHAFIAHYLYAFITFWCFVAKHSTLWLASIFFYGYLSIIKPTIIVGETSELFRIFVTLPPSSIFRSDVSSTLYNTFLDGSLKYDCLKDLAIIGYKKWQDLALDAQDYLEVVGNPVVVRYGPLPEHVAIYIPKYDPAGGSNSPSSSVPRDRLDREIRYLIERALIVVKAVGPIPYNASRQANLELLCGIIMEDARRLDILSNIEKAKDEARQAYVACTQASMS